MGVAFWARSLFLIVLRMSENFLDPPLHKTLNYIHNNHNHLAKPKKTYTFQGKTFLIANAKCQLMGNTCSVFLFLKPFANTVFEFFI